MKDNHHTPDSSLSKYSNGHAPLGRVVEKPLRANTPAAAGAQKEEGGLDIGEIFAAVRRQMLPFAAVVAAVTSAAIVFTLKAKPEYESRFLLLIEPATLEDSVAGAIRGEAQDVNLDATKRADGSVDYSTQINILLSPKLLQPVAQRLNAKYPDVSANGLSNTLQIQRYAGKTQAAGDNQLSRILSVTYRDSDPDIVKSVTEEVAQTYLNYSRKERQTNLGRAVKFVDDQLPSVQGQVEQLENAIQNFRQQHNLVDPTAAAAQLQSQIGEVEEQQLDNQVQLAQARAQYRNLQQQLGANPQQAMAASTLQEAPSYQRLLTQLQELDAQIAAQSVQLTDENPAMQVLIQRRAQINRLLQNSERQVLGTLAGQSSNVRQLPFQNSVRQDFTRQFLNTGIQIRTLESRSRELAGIKSNLDLRFGLLPSVTRQFESLQRRLQVNVTNLNNLMAKREELRLNVARREAPWELIEAPTQPFEQSRNLPRNIALGMILGALLGTGVAVLVDRSKKIIYTSKELRAAIDIKLLGAIPSLKPAEKVVLEAPTAKASRLLGGNSAALAKSVSRTKKSYYGYSPFLEAFRSLYTSVRYLRRTTPVRSLVISSALTGEGKSTVAVNFAKAAAAMGRRVLLVDADLRQPRVHSLLNLPSGPGVCEMVHSQLPLEQIIQPVPDHDGLYVVPAGILQQEATSVLASEEMMTFVQDVQERFSLVIYDTPPLGFADAALLANQTDGLALVAKLGTVDRSSLQDVIDLLEVSGVPILGVIANEATNGVTGSYGYSRKYAALERQTEGSDWVSISMKN
jgi:polysaccharide biosynthesis transport protein